MSSVSYGDIAAFEAVMSVYRDVYLGDVPNTVPLSVFLGY